MLPLLLTATPGKPSLQWRVGFAISHHKAVPPNIRFLHRGAQGRIQASPNTGLGALLARCAHKIPAFGAKPTGTQTLTF